VITVLGGVAMPPAPGEAPYLALPFEVPAGCVRIDVRYTFESGGEPPNVLDLGLLDPTVRPFPSDRGLRGWSGGARSQVFVGQDEATPGYLPGPLPAGTYRVLLGLARVGPDGCRYRVEVELDSHDAAPPGPGAGADAQGAPAAARPGGARPDAARTPDGSDAHRPGHRRWYRGDLHSHSHHSDARGSLRDLRAAAEHRGLEFLAVTDHNTTSHHEPLTRLGTGSPLLVPGMEVTTYRGHANVWGVRGPVDFRVRDDRDVERLVEFVHARGGLFSVNHPKRAPGCIGCDWEYHVPDAVDCVEAWQGPWALRNWESLERYDRLLAGGRRVTLVGGSDRHQPGWPDPDPAFLQLGSPTTWVELDVLDVASLLGALRSGRATVSEGPAGPRLELRVGPAAMGGVAPQANVPYDAVATVRGAAGETLRWVGAEGVVREVTIPADRFEDRWTCRRPGPFLRVEVCAAAGLSARRDTVEAASRQRPLPYGITVDEVFARPYRLALSNPVYFEV
jgi:hypothetical protein